MPKNKTKEKEYKKLTVQFKQKKVKKKKVPKKPNGKIDWKKYNDQLVKRGSLEIWVNKEAISGWKAKPSGKRGANFIYSDNAILTTLQLGIFLNKRLRQTEGIVLSLFKQMGIFLEVPDFTTLSRRSSKLKVGLPKTDIHEKTVAILDSSGLKVFGEGEWKVRKHGFNKHRKWLKFHIMIIPNGEIKAVKLTENNIHDAKVIEDLLDQEKSEKIIGLAGDGAYDKMNVYEAGRKRGFTKYLIPPQKNAKIKIHGNSKREPKHPRDENLRSIRKSSLKLWKEKSGYHIRSLVETVMFRFKTIFGDKINARKFANQITEFKIKARMLNIFHQLGMPEHITE